MRNSSDFNFGAIARILFLSLTLFASGCQEKGADQTSSAMEGADRSEKVTASGRTIIGAFLPDIESSTKAIEQGMQLAISASPSPFIELKLFDSAQGRSPDAATLKSLIEKDSAPVLLYWSTDDVSPVASHLDSSNSVGVILGDVTRKVAGLNSSIFGFGYSIESTFKQMAKFAGNTLKSYRFAVFTTQEPRFELQSKEFIEETKSLGNTIVFEEKITGATTDFGSLVARATREKCDTIFAVLPAAELASFIKAARSSQFNGKILVGDTLFARDLAAIGEDAEGIYATQAWSDDSNLKALYSAKYGNAPDGVTLGYTALGYDTVKCLEGMNKPLEASSIKYSFLSTPCEGLTGKTQFSGERIAQRRKKVLTVKSGQFVMAE